MKIEYSTGVWARRVAGIAREVFAPTELTIKYTTFLKGARMLKIWTKEGRDQKILARIILWDRFDLYDHRYLGKTESLCKRIETELSTPLQVSLFDPEIDAIQLRESDTANPVML